MLTKSVFAALFVVAGAFIASNAKADVVLGGNLGPGGTFTTGSGNSWATGDIFNSGNAVSFIAPTGSNYQLDSIIIGENWYSGSSSLNVGLYQGVDPDSASLVESFSLDAGGTSGASFLLIYGSAAHPLIIGGDTYWLEQTVPDCGTQTSCSTIWGWQVNDLTPQQTGFESEFAGGLWFPELIGATPAFQVNGTPVAPASTPEPGTFLLSSLPMALFFLKRRRG